MSAVQIIQFPLFSRVMHRMFVMQDRADWQSGIVVDETSDFPTVGLDRYGAERWRARGCLVAYNCGKKEWIPASDLVGVP